MKNKLRVKNFRNSIESKRLSGFVAVWSVIVLYAFTVLQASFLPFLKIGGATFDLLLTAALCFSIYTNEYYGAVYGVVMGAIFDMVNSSRIPIMPVVFLLLCVNAGRMFPGIKSGDFLRKFSVLLVSSAIRYFITFLLELFRNSTLLEQFFTIILPGFIYTMLVSPIVMLICSPVGREKTR